MYYQLDAEHISSGHAKQILDASDIEIECARMDPYFENCVQIVVDNETDAKAMRDLLWKANGGASVEMFTITEDQLEELL